MISEPLHPQTVAVEEEDFPEKVILQHDIHHKEMFVRNHRVVALCFR